jgi:hypothetical protein
LSIEAVPERCVENALFLLAVRLLGRGLWRSRRRFNSGRTYVPSENRHLAITNWANSPMEPSALQCQRLRCLESALTLFGEPEFGEADFLNDRLWRGHHQDITPGMC